MKKKVVPKGKGKATKKTVTKKAATKADSAEDKSEETTDISEPAETPSPKKSPVKKVVKKGAAKGWLDYYRVSSFIIPPQKECFWGILESACLSMCFSVYKIPVNLLQICLNSIEASLKH